MELGATTAESAARIGPSTLRSVDAIHLASALALGAQLEGLVTYDGRMADAARTAGLEVVAPGRDAIDEIYGSMKMDEPVDEYIERTRGR